VNTADDLTQVYQQVVLEHSRKPKHFGRLENATHQAEGFNPLCGDKVSLQLEIAGDQIKAAGHETTGCAICMASASMMTDALGDSTVQEATDLAAAIDAMLNNEQSADKLPGMPLDALEGVKAYRSRIKCATLPWRSLEAALQSPVTAGDAASVTTE